MSLKEDAKDLYFSNPAMTLKEVAEMLDIAYVTVREWARKEGWETERSMRMNVETPEAISEQAQQIRAVIYRAITTGSLSPAEIKQLVDAWAITIRYAGEVGHDQAIDKAQLLEQLLSDEDTD